ncbi:MAG TPA: 5-methyltetrahydropteroyltriglutamate--homocysteine methyltransferase [Alphaproteobacteria bacterium]
MPEARALPLLPTTVVGSYPQPDWLIDRDALSHRSPPRVRAAGLWRVAEPWLAEAQDDATRLAIADMERAGIDIITDGEIRRESYSNRFATALGGIDPARAGTAQSRRGRPEPVPLVSGPIRRLRPVETADVAFLRANTARTIKATLPGPFTLAQQAEDAYYRDPERLAMAYAEAVNAELLDLFAAGADIVQLDEPYLQARPEAARAFAVAAIDRALAGAPGTTALHLCMGYAALVRDKPPDYAFLAELADSAVDQVSVEAAQPHVDVARFADLGAKTVILGVLDLADAAVETPETVAARIERALDFVPAERLVPAPDCGMKYLPRAVALGKLGALAAGTAMVRARLAG